MGKAVPFPTQLIIGSDTAAELRANATFRALKKGHVAVISGPGRTATLAAELLRRLDLPDSRVVSLTCGDSTLATLHRLETEVIRGGVDLILAVGGGVPIDAAKVVGTRTHTPVVLVPTAVSSDAICSPVARFEMDATIVSVGVNMPEIVVIDLELLASCPERLLRAGIGDLVSNQSALVDWTLAQKRTGEAHDPFASLIARNAMDAFLGAWERDDPELLRVTAESLIMSGIAMAIAGSSRPCSGGEHLVSHALDQHCGARALHGEQVALGVLVTEHLHRQAYSERALARPLTPRFAELGLPTHYSTLGYSREEMKRALQAAPGMRARHTILNEVDLGDDAVERLLDEVFDDKR